MLSCSRRMIEDFTEQRRLGLIATDERVRMLGKTLSRVSHPGGGTRIAFSIPLDLESSESECVPPADAIAGGT